MSTFSSPVTRGVSVLLLALLTPDLLADSPLDRQSPILADLILQPDSVELTLRIRERDLPAVRSLTPSDCDLTCAARPLVLASTSDGTTLTAAEAAMREPANGQAEHRVQIHYRFPLATPPGQLELSSPSGLAPALLVLQGGVAISDRALLNGPVRLKLDWQQPWNSRFQGQDWARRHLQPKSFLYLEPHEIRHEWLQPLAWLPAKLWHSLGLDTRKELSPAQREALKTKLVEALPTLQTLDIDGQPSAPWIDRIEFVRQSPAGIEPVPADSVLATNAAQLGIMLAYPVKHPPTSLRLHWQAFSPDQTTHAIQLIRGQETLDAEVTRTHSAMDWSTEDMLDNPTPPSDQASSSAATGPLQAEELAELLLNAYRAFSLRGEEAAYDQLAMSLSSPLLDQVYLDQRLALIRKSRGLGGDSRVQRVELSQFKPVSTGQSERRIDASWVAHGQVSHWGHAHDRHTRYRALVDLERRADGSWRIKNLDFIDGQGLDAT